MHRIAIVAIVLLASAMGLAQDDEAPWITLPLSVQGPSDLDDAQVERWVDAVNAWYAPARVRFAVDERRSLPDDWVLLRTTVTATASNGDSAVGGSMRSSFGRSGIPGLPQRHGGLPPAWGENRRGCSEAHTSPRRTIGRAAT